MRRLSDSRVLRTLATVGVVFLVWQVAAIYVDTNYLLPHPANVFKAGYKIAASGELFVDLKVSLVRSLIGFGLAILIAIPVGMLAAWWKPIDETVGSFIELIRPIPALALIPLVIIWFGFGEVSKIMLITYACFFSIYINTHAGVRNVDPLFIKVMKVYGNGQRDILTKVVLYSMLPYTFAGLRYAAALSLIFLVAVELVGAQNGLGFSLVRAQQLLQTQQIYFTILIFGFLGFIFNGVVLFAERRVIRWRQAVGAQM
jgi:NitT/TauT family transport system permease protein